MKTFPIYTSGRTVLPVEIAARVEGKQIICLPGTGGLASYMTGLCVRMIDDGRIDSDCAVFPYSGSVVAGLVLALPSLQRQWKTSILPKVEEIALACHAFLGMAHYIARVVDCIFEHISQGDVDSLECRFFIPLSSFGEKVTAYSWSSKAELREAVVAAVTWPFFNGLPRYIDGRWYVDASSFTGWRTDDDGVLTLSLTNNATTTKTIVVDNHKSFETGYTWMTSMFWFSGATMNALYHEGTRNRV